MFDVSNIQKENGGHGGNRQRGGSPRLRLRLRGKDFSDPRKHAIRYVDPISVAAAAGRNADCCAGFAQDCYALRCDAADAAEKPSRLVKPALYRGRVAVRGSAARGGAEGF
jgi:hypothetical protein